MQEYRLKVSHVYKSFPGVQALKDINFAVRKGTVHVYVAKTERENRL